MKRFGIITNFNIYDKANAAMRVAEQLLSYGVDVLIPSVNKDRIFRMHKNRKEYTYLPIEEVCAGADCIIVLGGDGNEEYLAFFKRMEQDHSNVEIVVEKTVMEGAIMR